MAKKPKRCKNPMCLDCRWWPRVARYMGSAQGCYWVDAGTGEVFVATGLRALADGTLVVIDSERDPPFYEVQCDCGSEGFVRGDLLEQGKCDCCPACAANLSQIARN